VAPDYEPAWRALYEPLSWMQGHPMLNAYLGLNLADIANDLIARAYPELAPAIRAETGASRASRKVSGPNPAT